MIRFDHVVICHVTLENKQRNKKRSYSPLCPTSKEHSQYQTKFLKEKEDQNVLKLLLEKKTNKTKRANIFSEYIPIVGTVKTISPSFNLYRMVVFPDASRPTIRILTSRFWKSRFLILDINAPML